MSKLKKQSGSLGLACYFQEQWHLLLDTAEDREELDMLPGCLRKMDE